MRSFFETTEVEFAELSPELIRAYIATGAADRPAVFLGHERGLGVKRDVCMVVGRQGLQG